jgi:hypothetical protein
MISERCAHVRTPTGCICIDLEKMKPENNSVIILTNMERTQNTLLITKMVMFKQLILTKKYLVLIRREAILKSRSMPQETSEIKMMQSY